MKKYVISETQIQKLAFGQCCDFQSIVDDVHTRPAEDPCADNGCTDIEDCDEICQHSRIYSPIQMQDAIKRATEVENKRVLDDMRGKIDRYMSSDLNILAHRSIRENIWEIIQSLRIPQEIKK
jgi:hypothetical protein